jgi:uncharacterized SAM-binding protein YcdF (DUF218 family)
MTLLTRVLTEPYTVAFLLGGLWIGLLWYRRREARRDLAVVVVVFVALWMLSLPVVAKLLLRPLEGRNTRLERRPDVAQAIVVLSGSVFYPDDRHTELAEDSLYRCLHAADLYQVGPPCPVLTSGGKLDLTEPGPPFARVMADFLVTQGVKPADLILEDRSRSTYENAVESARILKDRGIHTVVVITESPHLLRSELCFRRQGIHVVRSASHYRNVRSRLTITDFLPSSGAPYFCQIAFHEYIGLAWYWLTGKV